MHGCCAVSSSCCSPALPLRRAAARPAAAAPARPGMTVSPLMFYGYTGAQASKVRVRGGAVRARAPAAAATVAAAARSPPRQPPSVRACRPVLTSAWRLADCPRLL